MRAIRRALFAGALGLASPLAMQAQYEWTSSRPDGHAPIGVMGDHAHGRGEYMLSYRFMNMQMEGLRSGTEPVSIAEAHKTFMMAPLSMTMMMHMVGVMYAPSDVVTLMAMGNWVDLAMHNDHAHHGHDHEHGHEEHDGSVASTGPGDASLSALIGLKRTGSTRLHLNAGVSFPVGSIARVGVTPMSEGRETQLPYPMQLGSGTWDVLPGITLFGMSERASWGGQVSGVLRANTNSRGYRKGHAGAATAWFAVRPSDYLSVSARVAGRMWGNYNGSDDAYANPMMTPAVREDLRGGTRIDAPLGVNLYFPRGALQGHRLAVEWSIPVYQDLDGPQLETSWQLTVGWQKSFEPFGH